MPRGKKEPAEQIIPKLREVEVEVGRGKTVAESVKRLLADAELDSALRAAVIHRPQAGLGEGLRRR